MELRFLKGKWEFGKFKLQYRDGVTHDAPWMDVPTVQSDLEPKGEETDHIAHTGAMVNDDHVDLVKPMACSNFKECPCCGITFAHSKVKTLRERIAEAMDFILMKTMCKSEKFSTHSISNELSEAVLSIIEQEKK